MTYLKTALLFFGLLFFGLQSYSQSSVPVKDITKKYKFSIVLLNGSTITAKQEVDVTSSQPMQKLVDANKTYLPEETAAIYVFDKDNKQVRGVALDGCWMFRTHSTSDAYFFSYLPESGTDYVVSCLLEDGAALEPLTKEVMEKIAKGNTKVEKELNKGNVRKALSVYLKDEEKKEKEFKKMEDKLNKKLAKAIVKRMFK